jgi:heterodisulfide reductase subunit A
VATGADVLKVSSLPFVPKDSPDIYDAAQFERIISSTGPTEGKLLKSNKEAPHSIAFIHCAGSRDEKYRNYCSGVCCAVTLKLAHLAHKKAEKPLQMYGIYSDWCLAGEGMQEFHKKVTAEGICYLNVQNPNSIEIIRKDKEQEYIIKYDRGAITADMIVLATAVIPAAGASELAAKLGIPQDNNGFFAQEHPTIAPAATTVRGIYLAGTASGPKDVPASVLQAQAASGLVLSNLAPGEKLEIEAATCHVNEERCGGCRICLSACPYQAIHFDTEKNVSVINDVLCKGCGVCACGCPAGAIVNNHFTQEQLFAEIEGILHDRKL